MAVVELPEAAPGAPGAPIPNPQQEEQPQMLETRLPSDLPWPKPFIVVPELVIRPYHTSDVPEVARIANNKKISRNMTNRFPHPYTEESARQFIAKAMDPKTSNVYAWTISLTPDGPPIGGCGLEPGSDVTSRTAEMGYWLGEEYWGKGYTTIACQALTDWAFEQEDGITGERLQRIEAGVFSGNEGSGKVLRKCGYQYEGTRRSMIYKWGEVRDLEMYGQRREDWERQRNERE